MSEPSLGRRALRDALAQAQLERERADRAARVAACHESEADKGPQLAREIRLRMARVHRQVEQRHQAAAAMYGSLAVRLRLWSAAESWSGVGAQTGVTPLFMAAVAETVDARGAALTLFGPDRQEVLCAASDSEVKAAQDLEFVCGEGPAHTSSSLHRTVTAAGRQLAERWPLYGPGALDLGVHRIAAVPLEIAREPLGALTVYEPGLRGGEPDVEQLSTIARTLVLIVLLDGRDLPGRVPLLSQADLRCVVHQATAIVADRRRCALADALLLVKARAFAEDLPVEQVARDIVAGRTRLDAAEDSNGNEFFT